MMRIVGGKHKGRKLFEPTNEPIRPALDRARESLFNILAHSFEKPIVYGARVLDAFAGTGAYGLEALSRGASFCGFIDLDYGSIALLKKNISFLGEENQSAVFKEDSTKLKSCPLPPFNLVILAPPYGKNLVNPSLESLRTQNWIAPNALIVAEVDAKEQYAPYQGIHVIFEKTYGRNRYYFYR